VVVYLVDGVPVPVFLVAHLDLVRLSVATQFKVQVGNAEHGAAVGFDHVLAGFVVQHLEVGHLLLYVVIHDLPDRQFFFLLDFITVVYLHVHRAILALFLFEEYSIFFAASFGHQFYIVNVGCDFTFNVVILLYVFSVVHFSVIYYLGVDS